MRYVICTETITSPAADPKVDGFDPDEPCNEHCPVVREGGLMEFRCPRGHHFYARREDIRTTLNALSNARHDMDIDDVRREALHDWLNERPPHERPDPSEYEDEPMMRDLQLETIAEAALTPWPTPGCER